MLGAKGVVEGPDYRQIPSIAYIQAIPNSPWFMVACVNRSEAYAPLYKQLIYVSSIAILAIFVFIAFILAISWQKKAYSYKSRYSFAEERLHEASERELLEKNLVQMKESQYTALIENLPCKVFLKDRSSVYISCNKNYAKDMNMLPNDIVGKTDFDLFPKYLAEKYKADDQRIMESGKTENIEEEYVAIKDFLRGAKKTFVNTIKIPVYDTAGNITGLLGLFWDVTERKASEEKLRLSEKKIKALFDQTFQFIGMMTVDGTLIEANRTAMQFAGIKESDCIGKPFWNTPWWTHSKEMQAKLREAVKKAAIGESVFFEATHVAADGKTHYVDFSLKPFRDENGDINFLIPEGRDITEHKLAENKLKESEESFRAIFEGTTDGLILVNPEGTKFYTCNGSFCRMLGYNIEEVKGLSIKDIHPADDLPHVFDQFRKLIRGESYLAKNIPVKRKDNTIFYADVIASFITMSGKPCVAGFFRDVTERKKLEEETRIAEEIKTSSEIKSKFTSMVSHELRSPLAVIKESINLVMEELVGDLTNEQKDVLKTAKNNIDRLSRLINNVLEFQKLGSARPELDLKEYNINDIILSTSRDMNILAEKKGLTFTVNIDESIPIMQFDKDKIVQVLTNLLSNAIKFTEKGGVIVSAEREDNVAHIVVEDTGPGMQEEELPRLFRAFEQLGGGLGKKRGGTGLGLAISKEIILAHNGKIWAESCPGKGSLFHFTLPITERRG